MVSGNAGVRFVRVPERDVVEHGGRLAVGSNEKLPMAAKGMDRATLARRRAGADALAQDRDNLNWVSFWADFDEDFHNAIAEGSGSPRLCQEIARYHLLHCDFNNLGTKPEGLEDVLEEHMHILDVLEKRSTKEAQRVMVDHLQEWQAFFVRDLREKSSV